MDAILEKDDPTKSELEQALKDKCYEIWKWSELIKERALGELPNGEPNHDFDGAFTAVKGANQANLEAQKLTEKLFEMD